VITKDDLLDDARENYTKDQIAKLTCAIDFATKAHESQKRANGDPFIVHPLNVADTLINWGMDIDSVIAGILHDSVEDANIPLQEIAEMFGHEIAHLIDGVTKVTQARSGMKDLSDYMPQTRENLSKLLIALGEDIRVVIIKLADRLHNLQTLNYLPEERRLKKARESLEVFAPIADRLGMGRVRMQIEELAFSYLDPKEFKRLQILTKKRLGKSTRKLGKIRLEVEEALKKNGIKFEINGRVKSIYSLYKKLKKVHGNIDDIYDLMALRIIVERKEDCYLVLSILHSLYKPMIGRIKDYISTPKPNGYQSLHTTVITPNEQIIEFQIRTREMHEYAERGLAASFHYNEQKNTQKYSQREAIAKLPNSMKWITQLQEAASKLGSNKEITQDQLHIDLFKDRIFVHSPKGDIFNLPEGALPLDFAYMVHSDIAKHANAFKVNGNIHPFDKPLQNGDIIEVVTNRLSLPKQSWKNLVITSYARSKLQKQLRNQEFVEMITKVTKNATRIIRKKKSK
jgi:guanosine-3',5'-bis(diphosphate) 3'-pyrophosphohydrolase